jgi:hypothetical protein
VDAVLTTLIGAAPQLGVGGVLLALLGLVIRWGSQERADNRTGVAELATRHAAELARVNSDHDTELAELRKEIAGLRGQLDEVNHKLDAERDRRRAAEDARRPPDTPALGQLQGEPPWAE